MRITLSDRASDVSVPWFHGAESMISGACAGLVSSTVTCPLDVIKTQLQASGGRGRVNRGFLGTISYIYSHNGIRGFYRGLGPTILGYLPTWAIYFTVYDRIKSAMEPRLGADHALGHVISAMTAGASGTLLTNPLWVVKTRFMTQSPDEVPYRNTWDCLKRTQQTEGIRTFYRGLVPSLFGLCHVVIQFPLYEQLKLYNRPVDGSPLSSSTILLCSALSKMVATVVTYPHEVLRTRLQIQKTLRSPVPGQPSPTFEGVVMTMKRILRENGFRGFYRGMLVNMSRTVPSGAVTILTYEVIMGKFTEYETRRRAS